MEEPYRLVYFVVTDQMRTTIAALRAVLKEGLQAPLRTPTAFIIDELHTLEVFRKQGLATSLTNFVKGIAEAHGVELFVSSELYIRSFWELRGFEEETSPEVLRACSLDLDDGFKTGAATTLLRAGAAYTEYQPANDERLSMRTLAARGLLAIPSSGSRDGVVDLTGGSRSLAEQDEEQMQLAIAMSLSAAAAEATCGGGGDAAAAAAIERSDGARHDGAVRGGEGETSAGDDTETEEDADYGGQLLGGDADAAAGGIASSAAAAPTSSSARSQQQPTTVGALGHRDPNRAMTASKENDPHHHHHHHQDHGRKAVYQPPPRGLGARGQQHQHQAAFAGDGGGMIGALGGVVYSPTTAGGTGGADVPGLGAGRFGNVGVGGGGGGLISDGIEPSDVIMRDFGVGADGLDGGGRLDDKLIAVAGWEGDDNDEELRRVMEASRQSHEEEMIQRATQESQQAAAAAAAAAAAEHLPQPPSNTAAAAPSSSLPPLSRKGVAAATPNGGGPDVAVLPSFGSLGARESTGVGVGAGVHGHGSDASGAALPSTCGGAAASSSGFRAGAGGGAADSAAAAAAAAGAQAPAWLGGWEDGEAVSFTAEAVLVRLRLFR
ncbi:hypothetical protein Esi_0046_0035 [Ectocarpus siliculosus]|uniref:Uncharacterized protein n=1 Tax=Ectocarpus siliculosus TaxID=2880 RepID=D7G1U4_ECTSI|nr:hypothetical protein Esi_0046_0035 [Ectocarpus siliculosus]|eukprot:CBJ48670.1 hypothetical protein Esi_0046_0035 [Ectocarpus siliculosus]